MDIFDFTRCTRLVVTADSGCLDGSDNGVDHCFHPDLLGNSFKAQDQTVPEHAVCQGLYVLRDHVVAAVQEGYRPGCLAEGDAGAGAGAELDETGKPGVNILGCVPGDVDQSDNVTDDRGIDVYAADQLLDL
jgi:hypothetical protein